MTAFKSCTGSCFICVFSLSILVCDCGAVNTKSNVKMLLVAPGSGPLHFTPGVPDADQLGQVSSVHDLQTQKHHWSSLRVTLLD